MEQINPHVDWLNGLHVQGYCKDGNPIDDVIGFFNANAKVYEHDMAAYRFNGHKQAGAMLHKYLKGNVEAKILDVACGTGQVIRQLKEFAPYTNAYGLDPSDSMVDLAKQDNLYKDVFLQRFNINSGIEHNSYDIVSCSGAIIPGHIQPEAIKEMIDIVKPDGYVIIVMRLQYISGDFKDMMPMIHKMVADDKILLVEETTFSNYFSEEDGLTIVLQKL